MNNSAFTLTIDDDKLAWLKIDVPNEKNEHVARLLCY